MPEQMDGERAFDETERILRGDGAGGDGRLRIVGSGERDLLDERDLRGERLRVAGAGGGVLILAADIEREAAAAPARVEKPVMLLKPGSCGRP